MGATQTKLLASTLNDIYSERIVNVLNTNTTRISNIINLSQDIKFKYKCGRDLVMKCDNWTIDQNALANANVMTQVTQSQSADIRSMFENDISNKNSQTMKAIYGFLSSYAEYKNHELTNEFVTRLRQIINSNITQQNIASIISKTQVYQNQEFNYEAERDCIISGSLCSNKQNISVKFISTNIIQNVINTVVSDSVIQRIVNENSQSTEVTQKGLDSLVKALFSTGIVVAIILAIGGYIYLKFMSSINPLNTVTEIAKQRPYFALFAVIVVILIIVLILYFPVAWLLSIWPFSGNKILWKCEKNEAGFNTGKCVSGKFESGYTSKDECEKKGVCGQYWGCDFSDNGEFNGKCKQYARVIEGPIPDKQTCEDKIKKSEMCTYGWGCKIKQDGTLENTCTQYKDPNLGVWKTEAICNENRLRGACNNKWKCIQGACSEVHPMSEWAMFDTKQECERLCKK